MGLELLDCTLRDGGYAIDFAFSESDTSALVGALDGLGIRLIEVGHGLGLGGSRMGYPAAASDDEYIDAAVQSSTTARIGCFFQPAIGTLDDLRRAADRGLSFVRIGVDVTDHRSIEPAITLAHQLRLTVTTNLMKSTLLQPQGFARVLGEAVDMGADVVYIVDSFGSMTPDDVRQYVEACRMHASQCPLGFHGHDNLGFANANSLAFVHEGGSWVDATLQGVGRSSGNACLEVLARVLGPRWENSPPWDGVARAGERLLRPLFPRASERAIEIALGAAGVHSSALPAILRISSDRRVDALAVVTRLAALAGRTDEDAIAMAARDVADETLDEEVGSAH